MAEEINPYKLICMDLLAERYDYRVELAYAREDNLLFGERIYREDAQLWLYEPLAHIVCLAAQACYATHGLRFVLYDGLRTIEAQEAMTRAQRAIDNPQWMEEPRLLSLPGCGGHPRGMAIDIGLEGPDGLLINMGCPFDCLDETAHRDYAHSQDILENRAILDGAMLGAADTLGIELSLLSEEWWDFRLPRGFYGLFEPISEQILPKNMKLMQ